jgi:hypothetical protein
LSRNDADLQESSLSKARAVQEGLPPEILQDIFASALAENEPVLAKQDPDNYAHIFYEKRNLAVMGPRTFLPSNLPQYREVSVILRE